jgi:hypothetical protein
LAARVVLLAEPRRALLGPSFTPCRFGREFGLRAAMLDLILRPRRRG